MQQGSGIGGQMRAIDKIYERSITESELAGLLQLDPKRIRDLRSFHNTGKQKFIDHVKLTGKTRLYKYEDVLAYLESAPFISFGKGDINPDSEE